MPGLATVGEHAVARPLKVLVPLIKEQLQKGDEAAAEAGMPYYRKAGELLTEAREGEFEGNITGFYEWAEKTFGRKRTQISTYVALAAASKRKSFKSLNEFRRKGGFNTRTDPIGPGSRIHREWTAPVDEVAQRARQEQFRLAQEDALTRAQEREAERKLAHRLIDIGYKVLAKELHPDKLHGDKDAMRRLNRVRDFLKGAM